MKKSESISNRMYILRLFAILMVIAVHVNRSTNTSYKDTLSIVYSIISMIGVPIFFIIAGYYYKGYTNIEAFIKKKLINIVLPWIIAGIITYIFHSIKVNLFSIIGLFKWIVGYKTFYYYLTVYLFFQLLFKYINNNKILLFMVGLNIIFLGLEQTNNMTYGIITPYLNPLNWCGYFCIGRLLNKTNFINRIDNIIVFCTSILLSILFFTICFNTENIDYFNVFSFIFTINMFIVLFYISKMLTYNKIVEYGKYTFFIYIYHIQIVQFICFRMPNTIIINIINPIIGLGIMILIIFVLKKIYDSNKSIIKYTKLIGLDFEK